MTAPALDDARNAEKAARYFAHIADVIRAGLTPLDYDWAKAAEYSAAAMRVNPPADYADMIAEAAEDDARNAAADDCRIIRMETFA